MSMQAGSSEQNPSICKFFVSCLLVHNIFSLKFEYFVIVGLFVF